MTIEIGGIACKSTTVPHLYFHALGKIFLLKFTIHTYPEEKTPCILLHEWALPMHFKGERILCAHSICSYKATSFIAVNEGPVTISGASCINPMQETERIVGSRE